MHVALTCFGAFGSPIASATLDDLGPDGACAITDPSSQPGTRALMGFSRTSETGGGRQSFHTPNSATLAPSLLAQQRSTASWVERDAVLSACPHA